MERRGEKKFCKVVEGQVFHLDCKKIKSGLCTRDGEIRVECPVIGAVDITSLIKDNSVVKRIILVYIYDPFKEEIIVDIREMKTDDILFSHHFYIKNLETPKFANKRIAERIGLENNIFVDIIKKYQPVFKTAS